MKIRQIILLAILITSAQFCFGQADSTSKASERFVFKAAPASSPLIVLKSDKRTMELDPKNNEVFDLNSIDTKWVKSITVLKGEEAKNTYGERGSNGVLIVQLVDNYIFSKPVFNKFKPDN